MPLQVGDKVSLTINDIAFGGEGVGRVATAGDSSAARTGDFVVFVPFVLAGEVVDVEITDVKKNYARAKLLRLEKLSPERVEPQCVYFAKCGGCQYQHIAYAAQLRIKHKQIANLLEHMAGIPLQKVAPLIPCPAPYGYRNRVMIRSQWNKPEQKLNIGFVRWDCGLVEDIESCAISEPVINEGIRRVRAHPPPKGGIKIVLRVQPENWEVPADSFFQNNFFLAPKLRETARNFLRDADIKGRAGNRRLLDLYCGVGFFGIEMADLVKDFTGVEYDRRAIEAARKNIRSRGITNGRFISGRAEDVLRKMIEGGSAGRHAGLSGGSGALEGKEDDEWTVLLDPPRKGCERQVLELLRQARPSQIIYVSCHPATMARDLNILQAQGVFELFRVQPLDMFPQTQHAECMADLRAAQNIAKRQKMSSNLDKSDGL